VPGKKGSGGIELGAEVDGGGVLERGGLMVHAHRECAGGEVGDEVDGRQVEGARVVGAGEFFSDNFGHGGLGAVGEQFDGSDEVFFFRPELREALLGGQRLRPDVFGLGGARGLGRCELGLRGDEIGLELAFFAGETFQLGRFGGRREARGPEGGGAAGDGGALTAHGVDGLAPGGVDDLGGVRKGRGAVFDQPVETVVLAHIFEEVFLTPPGHQPRGEQRAGRCASRCSGRRLGGCRPRGGALRAPTGRCRGGCRVRRVPSSPLRRWPG